MNDSRSTSGSCCRTESAAAEPMNTSIFDFCIANSAAMKKVLSPSSDAKMSSRAATPLGCERLGAGRLKSAWTGNTNNMQGQATNSSSIIGLIRVHKSPPALESSTPAYQKEEACSYSYGKGTCPSAALVSRRGRRLVGTVRTNYCR